MKKLQDFFEILDATHTDDIVTVAERELNKPYNWRAMVHAYVTNLDEDLFVSRVQKMNIQLVEPRVLMIHENEGHYQVIVHLFNLAAFTRLMSQGRIGPHFHHFSFCTRILRGGYWNINYANTGSIQNPDLTFSDQSYCDEGTVYSLRWDEFHQVLRPEHFTVSLMIRSKPIYDIDHGKEKNYQRREILRKRRLLLDALQEPGKLMPGKKPAKGEVDFVKIFA